MTEQVNVAEGVKKYQMNRDLGEDLARPQLPIDFNLGHLTLSETTMDYIDKHQILAPLKPLADQVFGTAYLDRWGVYSYKMKVKRIVLRIKTEIDEDSPEEHHALRVIETYLNSYIESCLGGYRGKLATEIRRIYRQETDTPEKRRWGL